MDKDEFADLHGKTVKLNGDIGPLRECAFGQECDDSPQVGVVEKTEPPHAARLRCQKCGRHLSWLSRQTCAGIRATLEASHG